ncbi:MAG: MgtC/SapB family protein, partial [Patescibacteria group bacterium]
GNVVGLTTAAGLWAAAAIGMAVGLQMYMVALFAAVIALIILWPLKKFEVRIDHVESGGEKI